MTPPQAAPSSYRMRLPKITPSLPPDAPHLAASFNQVQQIALQALARGEANADQQAMALDWILNYAARTYDVSFRNNNPHGTSFAEGRRFTGLQIIRLLTLPIIEDEPGKPAMSRPQLQT